jgi:hypothetical protein
MEYLIADTFTDSLARLTGEEQKAAKLTAMDLQLNPAQPGLQFHKLDKCKDPDFWSVRVTIDIRLIVHRTAASLLLCYVAHHDKAYQWAERRKLETHPKTGAAQLVEIRETVREIAIPVYVEKPEPAPRAARLFDGFPDSELMSFGVPREWLADVRDADQDRLWKLADHLPGEAVEALFDIVNGLKPQPAQPVAPGGNPFAHPDARRRFRLMNNVEELERALDFPWDKWTVFLHPAQRQLVEKNYNGAARVAGSAGTGKTIVALHRAVWLARQHPEARVLLTTFSDTLAAALETKLRRLIGNEPRVLERMEVSALDAVGRRLYEKRFGKVRVAEVATIRELLTEAGKGSPFSVRFLCAEWEEIVDAWQLTTWEEYRTAVRLGRKSRLTEKQRAALWEIFATVQAELATRGLITASAIFHKLATSPAGAFDFAIVDESQDVSVAQLRFLAGMGAGRKNALFFAGDTGQRIFQPPFSWKSLGVDVRGRASTLRINYRTSHQIRAQADRLLAPEVSDIDGNTEERNRTVSTFNGPDPIVRVLGDEEAEAVYVGEWLHGLSVNGMATEEMAVFVRTEAQLARAKKAVAGLNITTMPMHLAKGLEFRAVVVMACDDGILPLEERLAAAGDESDLEEVFNTERHLLYVACTRARDNLLVTAAGEASEFLEDLVEAAAR